MTYLILSILLIVFMLSLLANRYFDRHGQKYGPLLPLLPFCMAVWAPVMAVNYGVLSSVSIYWWVALAVIDVALLLFALYLETHAQRVSGAGGWMTFAWLMMQPFLIVACLIFRLCHFLLDYFNVLA